MTLGPAILLLASLHRFEFSMKNPLMVFGRVPLFYFIGHLWVLRGLAVAVNKRFSLWVVYRCGSPLLPLCTRCACGLPDLSRDGQIGGSVIFNRSAILLRLLCHRRDRRAPVLQLRSLSMSRTREVCRRLG